MVEGLVNQGQMNKLQNNIFTRKNMHQINPLGMRVVIRIPQQENKTDSGLYLPEGAKENMSESLLVDVVEVASAIDRDTQEDTNVSGIPLGAKVLIKKNSGVKVPWDDNLRIVDTKEVLATVDVVNIS